MSFKNRFKTNQDVEKINSSVILALQMHEPGRIMTEPVMLIYSLFPD